MVEAGVSDIPVNPQLKPAAEESRKVIDYNFKC